MTGSSDNLEPTKPSDLMLFRALIFFDLLLIEYQCFKIRSLGLAHLFAFVIERIKVSKPKPYDNIYTRIVNHQP